MSITNTQLAASISALVNRWDTREGQMIRLLTQEDGTVVVTDGLGVNHTLPSFPQLQADVTAMVSGLTGAAAQAAEHANTALQHRNSAADFAADSEASAVRAEEAAAAVESVAEDAAAAGASASSATASAAAAATSATAAATSATSAASSASSASSAASTATTGATSASTSATSAAGSASAASGSAAAAATSATNADTSRASAVSSATAASTSATAAATSASAAASSATAAAGSATNAATSATSASSSATSATSASAAASSSATAASGAATAASASASKASSFANAALNVEVEPGQYSARHWALQAQANSTGALVYMGSWSAASGAYPGSAAKGNFYKVSAAGTVGGVEFGVGDQIVHNGTDWDKIDNTEAVSSVAGKIGAVTLAVSDISGLQTNLDGKAAASHTHTIANVTGLQTALDAKLASSSFTWANLGSKPTTLSGFGITDAAAASHTHTIANVTGLQPALDAKLASSAFTWANLGSKPASPQDAGFTSGRLDTFYESRGALSGYQMFDRTNTTRSWVFYADASIFYLFSGFTAANMLSVSESAGSLSLLRSGSEFLRAAANSATLTRQPRIFVGGSDPGAAAADGDLWIT